MCGIFGYYGWGKQIDQAAIAAMGTKIKHRGPDDRGVYYNQHVALGNMRLSIIDLESGHQPFQSEDQNIVVVQNGEIYNYIELAKELAHSDFPCKTHSDTEVILRLYQKYGIDFVPRLNGMFSIAIYDRRIDALYLIRDRVGIKPLYAYQDANQLLFASEIKSMICAGMPVALDPEALHHMLSFNYVPPPYTLFQGVRHVLPGHWMQITQQGISTKCWWNAAQYSTLQRNEQEWKEQFLATLEDAVKIRLRCDVPYGAFLSGGVDSSSVVGMISKHIKEPVRTYSIGFDEAKYDESPYAAQISKRFATRHTLARVKNDLYGLWPLTTYFCDQPHGDVSFLPTYKLAQLAKRDVTVVLTGDGGDELFAGYDKYRHFFANEQAQAKDSEQFYRNYFNAISLFSESNKLNLYSDSMQQKVANCSSYALVEQLFDRSQHMDRINQALYIDTTLLLPGNNLVKPDRMGMAHSLEARTPFLDPQMLSLAFQMPGSLKLKQGETKYLFKAAVKELIGEDIAYRKKQMFTVPIERWFKGIGRQQVENLLLSDRTKQRGYFNPKQVANLFSDYVSGKVNYTREVRALAAIEIWCRLFLDNDSQAVSNAMSSAAYCE